MYKAYCNIIPEEWPCNDFTLPKLLSFANISIVQCHCDILPFVTTF